MPLQNLIEFLKKRPTIPLVSRQKDNNKNPLRSAKTFPFLSSSQASPSTFPSKKESPSSKFKIKIDRTFNFDDPEGSSPQTENTNPFTDSTSAVPALTTETPITSAVSHRPLENEESLKNTLVCITDFVPSPHPDDIKVRQNITSDHSISLIIANNHTTPTIYIPHNKKLDFSITQDNKIILKLPQDTETSHVQADQYVLFQNNNMTENIARQLNLYRTETVREVSDLPKFYKKTPLTKVDFPIMLAVENDHRTDKLYIPAHETFEIYKASNEQSPPILKANGQLYTLIQDERHSNLIGRMNESMKKAETPFSYLDGKTIILTNPITDDTAQAFDKKDAISVKLPFNIGIMDDGKPLAIPQGSKINFYKKYGRNPTYIMEHSGKYLIVPKEHSQIIEQVQRQINIQATMRQLTLPQVKENSSLELRAPTDYQITDTLTIGAGSKFTISRYSMGGFTLKWQDSNQGTQEHEFRDYRYREIEGSSRSNKTTHPLYETILDYAEKSGFPQSIEYRLTRNNKEANKFITFLEQKGIKISETTKALFEYDDQDENANKDYQKYRNSHRKALQSLIQDIALKGIDFTKLLQAYDDHEQIESSQNNLTLSNRRHSLPINLTGSTLPLVIDDRQSEETSSVQSMEIGFEKFLRAKYPIANSSESASQTSSHPRAGDISHRRFLSLPINLAHHEVTAFELLNRSKPQILPKKYAHRKQNSVDILQANNIVAQMTTQEDYGFIAAGEKVTISYNHISDYRLLREDGTSMPIFNRHPQHGRLIADFHTETGSPYSLVAYLEQGFDEIIAFLNKTGIKLSESSRNNIRTMPNYSGWFLDDKETAIDHILKQDIFTEKQLPEVIGYIMTSLKHLSVDANASLEELKTVVEYSSILMPENLKMRYDIYKEMLDSPLIIIAGAITKENPIISDLERISRISTLTDIIHEIHSSGHNVNDLLKEFEDGKRALKERPQPPARPARDSNVFIPQEFNMI